MRYDERRPHWLVFAESAPDEEDWYRLMIENPANGQISTISTNIIDLEGPKRSDETTSPQAPPMP
ncbi:MAG: hypothetical protein H6506_01895 [Calditrichaeota bacterium]|nr:hypothetical protein [Calditrichota bacterium]MCB9391384.1 hypothetical protein [Calditrichota bacterium]